jgi:hypothetical protein
MQMAGYEQIMIFSLGVDNLMLSPTCMAWLSQIGSYGATLLPWL